MLTRHTGLACRARAMGRDIVGITAAERNDVWLAGGGLDKKFKSFGPTHDDIEIRRMLGGASGSKVNAIFVDMLASRLESLWRNGVRCNERVSGRKLHGPCLTRATFQIYLAR